MIYINNKQIGLSANEVNNLVTKLIENKQDKKIVFEGQEMLLTTALQRVNNSAVGKANIIDAETLPDTLTPNSQYWVKTYNGQTIDNGRYIILVDNLGTPHYMGESTSGFPVNDIQINGSSIVDGATKIANIQPKATIDSTSTENDIPSAKGVLDLFNSCVENVTNRIGKSSQFTINDFKAFKIGNKLLCVKFQVVVTRTMQVGANIMLALKNLEKAGITNTESVAGMSYCSKAPTATFYNKNSAAIYLNVYEKMDKPSVQFSYLIPINI